MDKRTASIVAIVAVVLIGGLFVYLGSNKDEATDSSTTPSNTSTEQKTSDDTDSQAQDTDASDQATATSQDSTTVSISNSAFSSKQITVKVGTTVTWTNQDDVKHNVVSDDGSADGPKSELLAKGETYSYTFTKAGVYDYHCTPHPFMKASVIVTE